MKTHLFVTLALISISTLSGCQSFSGNVIPQHGPTMEMVYDSLSTPQKSAISKKPKLHRGKLLAPHQTNNDSPTATPLVTALPTGNQNYFVVREAALTSKQKHAPTKYSSDESEFQKVPNPELHLYVFPHFAGKEEVPIPGYTTVFNAYDSDHYTLSEQEGNV